MISEKLYKESIKKILELQEQNTGFHDQIESLVKQNIDSQKIISDLTTQITILNASIIELTRRLHQDSSNSSKPSSADPYRKPSSKHINSREKTRKKVGGQSGHKGSTVQKFELADEVIKLDSAVCPNCGRTMHPYSEDFIAKQFVDIVMKRMVKEYRSYDLICSCGNQMQAPFPNGLNNPVEYSSNIKMLLPYFSNIQMVSMNRIQEMMEDLFDIHLSQGTIVTYNCNMIDKLQTFKRTVKAQLLKAPFLHFDETGTRIQKHTSWVHITSYGNLTYLYPHQKRGIDAIADGGILQGYRGVAIHDHWKSYFKFQNCDHAECMQHILRNLQSIVDSTGDSWANQLMEVIRHYYHERKSLQGNGINTFTETDVFMFLTLYDVILEEGEQEHNKTYPPVKTKKGKDKKDIAIKLINRLQEYKECYVEWVHNFSCPFTNNKAESGLRMQKTKTKISGCYRSMEGAIASTLIRSYILTVRASGENIVEQLQQAVDGNCYIPLLQE